MKLNKFLLASLLCMSSLSSSYAADSDYDANDYDSEYYDAEGILLFKLRGSGILTTTKQKALSKIPEPEKAKPVGALVKNGYGAEAATTVFFNDHIAAEAAVGFNLLRTKYSTVKTIGLNYKPNSVVGKRKNIYMIPLTFGMQFHVAPFGGIRPYIGGGYHLAYVINRAQEFKVENGHGPVFQIGADFMAKDDTLINLDVKQYFLKSKIKYSTAFAGAPQVTAKAKINPLLISVGIGFKF